MTTIVWLCICTSVMAASGVCLLLWAEFAPDIAQRFKSNFSLSCGNVACSCMCPAHNVGQGISSRGASLSDLMSQIAIPVAVRVLHARHPSAEGWTMCGELGSMSDAIITCPDCKERERYGEPYDFREVACGKSNL